MPAVRPQFVSAQPDEPWFIWQVHVYMQNLVDLGVEQHQITALFGVEIETDGSVELHDLIQRFPDADIRVMPDRRDDSGRKYLPSIQPHLIERWLIDEPHHQHDMVLYHDADVAWRWLPDFAAMKQQGNGCCFLSDSSTYIGHGYLHSACEKMRKELPDLPIDDLLVRMSAVVGIDPDLVRRRADEAGGAQYLLNGVGPEYWAKVYRDSIALQDLFERYAKEVGLSHETKHYIQTWTAGMWAYLWNLWLGGHDTVVHPELDFLFSADSLDETSPIMHMAGLAGRSTDIYFNKATWRQDNPVAAVEKQRYLFDGYPPGSVAAEYASMIRAAAAMEPLGLAPESPSRFWRVLSWGEGLPKGIWDVERLHFVFDRSVTVTDHLASGSAGEDFAPAYAFEDSPRVWGGRAAANEGHRPELFLGVELDEPATPTSITLINAHGEHAPTLVLIQRSDDGSTWVTAAAGETPSERRHHVLFYAVADPEISTRWRFTGTHLSNGFAWDVVRARFLLAGQEQQGQLSASGDAGPGFSIDNVTNESDTPWGGRPDSDGRFSFTLSVNEGVAIDRLVLHQGESHWAPEVEVECQLDGEWRAWRRFDDLGPGRNELFLYADPPGASRLRAQAPVSVSLLSSSHLGPRALDEPFADRRILVLIAAYRDPELASTIANAIAQAAYPEHLRFAICNQHDDDTSAVLDPWRDDPRFSIDEVPFTESHGCCWARHRTFELFDDEPYMFQIDAHTRFAARWDVRYIDMLESTGVDLPVLTSYPPSYRIVDGEVVYDLDAGVQRLKIVELRDDLTTLQKTERVLDSARPGTSPTLAAGQIFSRGSFCRDVGYDPNIYFAGEEISLAVRAFTNGYDLLFPNENLIWHLYDHDHPKHWDDHDAHHESHTVAVGRLRTLFQGDSTSLAPYGLGKDRSIAAFEEMAGVQLHADAGKNSRTDSQKGAPVDASAHDLVVQIDRWAIEQRDDWSAFVVVFIDSEGNEVARRSIYDPNVLCLARPAVTLARIDIAAATHWLLIPVTHTGTVGEFAVRPLSHGVSQPVPGEFR